MPDATNHPAPPHPPLHYATSEPVQVGDIITHHNSPGTVESLHDADELASWGLEREPGFMIICEQCGRVMINPDSPDWEDVTFVHRGE